MNSLKIIISIGILMVIPARGFEAWANERKFENGYLDEVNKISFTPFVKMDAKNLTPKLY